MDKETSDIAGLTERISKDPKSKLFVPLAEEYRKTGDIEMAIYVLMEGLKNNPDYVTAQSSLGKFLLINGDLAGAQAEFEKVVTAVPDNLMAQRKLGDIYIIQNRPQDALVNYKKVFAFNPKDEELASLISEVEAGQDVSSKIQLPKAKKDTDDQAVKQESSASVVVSKPVTVSSPASKNVVEPVTPVIIPPVSQKASPVPIVEAVSAPATAAADEPVREPEPAPTPEPAPEPAPEPTLATEPTPAPEPLSQAVPPASFAEEAAVPASEVAHEPAPALSLMKTDEPEEVPIVESLELQTAVQEPPASSADISGEKEPEAAPSSAAEQSPLFDFSADSDVQEEVAVSEDFYTAAEPIKIEGTETSLPDAPEKPFSDEIVEAESVREVSEKVPEQGPGTMLEPSDDFATDTLAELYIAQGFFEKAIEIYERMQADKPNSRGLQDKLASVRAEATRRVTPAAEEYKAPDGPLDQEVTKEVPVAEAGDVAAGLSIFDEWEKQEVKTADVKHEAVAEAREDVTTVEPEEIAIEAEVLTDPGELKRDGPLLDEDIFPESDEFKPAEPAEQLKAAGAARSDAVAASPVKGQTPSKPQFTDFEPREYMPPKLVRESLKPKAGKKLATPTPGFAGRKETIARLESWLTTIKKEK
jgi:tetratricopeptide (TPR) repeat protein